MASIMSMEDLFYGPPESTWILPTRDDRPYYRERDFSPRRFHHAESLRPVERYHPQPRPVLPQNDIRPVARVPPQPVVEGGLRPVERLARVHTVPEPVRVREEIRRVDEPVVKSAVPVPTQVITQEPVVKSAVPVPTQVITQVPVVPKPAPPPPVQVVQKAPPPVQVVQKPRTVSPPKAVFRHPIELKVPMCCEKCARKVKERLLTLEGVESVITDQYNQKVTVHGRVDPARVLNRVKLVKKRSVFWDLTVDYSENYRRARQAEDAALAREQNKAAVAKEAAKSVVTPAPAKVVVNLPQDYHGPAVQAVLPETNPMRMHQARYESPATGFRQEFMHGPREEMMMRNPEFHHQRHGERF